MKKVFQVLNDPQKTSNFQVNGNVGPAAVSGNDMDLIDNIVLTMDDDELWNDQPIEEQEVINDAINRFTT